MEIKSSKSFSVLQCQWGSYSKKSMTTVWKASRFYAKLHRKKCLSCHHLSYPHCTCLSREEHRYMQLSKWSFTSELVIVQRIIDALGTLHALQVDHASINYHAQITVWPSSTVARSTVKRCKLMHLCEDSTKYAKVRSSHCHPLVINYQVQCHCKKYGKTYSLEIMQFYKVN